MLTRGLFPGLRHIGFVDTLLCNDRAGKCPVCVVSVQPLLVCTIRRGERESSQQGKVVRADRGRRSIEQTVK